MMKVLHVIPSISPKRGGPSHAVWNMMHSVQPHGIEIELITTDDDGPGGRLTMPLGRPVEQNGVSVRYFPKQSNFYTISWPLLRWLTKHVKEFDLLHIHALFSFASVAAAWVARRQQIPFIIRPLGTLNRWGRTQRQPWLKRASIRFLEGPLLEAAGGIHFTSVDEERQAAELGLQLPSFVLPLGFDLASLAPAVASASALEMFPQLDGKQVILFISRIDPKKGLELLIDAFADLVQIKDDLLLVIAGDGDLSYVKSLQHRAGRSGVEDNIVWTGFVSGQKKAALWAAADLFVLPSHSENFGIVVVEALAAGVPIVTTDGVALHHAVQEARAGLVVPTNQVESLREAIFCLLSQPDVREQMGQKGQLYAQAHFSSEEVGQKLASIYDKIGRKGLKS